MGFLFTLLHPKPETVRITFADGNYTVPDYIVAHLGGRKKLEARGEEFRLVRCADFMQAVERARERDYLRDIQSNFVSNALHRSGRPWER